MANRFFRIAADLLNSYKRAEGLSLKSPITAAHATMVGMDIAHAGAHPSVCDELLHAFQRQLYHGSKSEIEVRGAEWRKAHGFGRPFFSGYGSGKSAAHREREEARAKAAKRKAQKASRVRTRIAAGMRNIASATRSMLFRGASRGS